MSELKLICFDFDGTIADTMPVLENNAVSLLIKYHPSMSLNDAIDNYRRTTGLPFEQQVEIIFPNISTNNEMVEEFENLKVETIFNQELFPETNEALSILKSKGYIIAISSSTIKEIIVEYLQRKEISNSIDIVLGYRPGFEKGKHHFDFLKEKFQLSSSSILYVGDSLKDMERAMSSHVNFIGRTSVMNSADDFIIKFDGKEKREFPTIDNLLKLFPLL
ncbi:MAG: HAD family hydrolase [Candidatus Hodarchaeales archaeon]